jgi:hypothetical protein
MLRCAMLQQAVAELTVLITAFKLLMNTICIVYDAVICVLSLLLVG